MAFSYSQSSVPSYKHLVEHDLQSRLFDFRKNQKEQVFVFEPAPMWGHVKSRPTEFTKESYPLKPLHYQEGQMVSTLQIIKRKDIFESFTLHTTGDNIREMTRWGIVLTSSLTGGVISALGKYRLITFADRIMSGYISNRFQEKFWMLDMMQDRFEALGQLENLVNQNIAYGELPQALAKMRTALQQYIDRLNAIKNKYHLPINHLETIDEDIARADEYLRNVNEDNFALHNQAMGPYSILSYVRDTLLLNLNEMQGINKTLTYDIADHQFAGTSGDMNSAIMDGFKVIGDHDVDLHNAIQNGHHGLFGKTSLVEVNNEEKAKEKKEKEEVFAYNSWQHHLSPREQQRALVAISFIEGMNQLKFPDATDMAEGKVAPYILNEHGEFNLAVVAATKWQISNPVGSFFRLCANFLVRVTAGFLDLWTVVITSPFKSYDFVKTIRKYTNAWATKEFNILETDLVNDEKLKGNLPILAGYEFRDAARPRLMSLASKAGRLLLNLYDNTVVDSARGLKDVFLQFTFKAAHAILDYHAEGYEKRDFNTVMEEVEQEAKKVNDDKTTCIATINRRKHEVVAELGPDQQFLHQAIDEGSHEPDEKKYEPFHPDQTVAEKFRRHAKTYAITEYVPTGAEMNDIFNATMRGGKKFADLYMHNIFAKHKVVGLVFAAVYVAGGLSVLMPELMGKYLSAKFVSISQTLGHATASGKTSAAIAAAVNESQFAAAFLEFIFHGPKSWFVTGANELSADPATTLIYISAAIAIGHLAIYEFDIPGLSEELRSNMGTVPPVAWGFAGAKIGILLVEFIHAKEREELDQMDSITQRLRDYLKDLYCKNHPEIQDAETVDAFVKTSISQLFKANHLDAVQEVFGSAKKDTEQLKHPVVRQYYDDTIKRFRITSFIEENMENLPYLSPHKKHELMRQIKSHFTPEQAASLKKTLYPEGSRSIMRTTISVVFGLGSGIIVLAVAAMSSLYHGNLKPLNRAIEEYAEKLSGIKTRIKYGLAVCFQTVLSVINRIAILTPLDILANSIGARLFTVITGSHWLTRLNYRISAMFDRLSESFYQRMSSLTGMGNDLKEFTTPHHADVRHKTLASYVTMFETLVPNQKEKRIASAESTEIESESFDIGNVRHESSLSLSFHDTAEVNDNVFVLPAVGHKSEHESAILGVGNKF